MNDVPEKVYEPKQRITIKNPMILRWNRAHRIENRESIKQGWIRDRQNMRQIAKMYRADTIDQRDAEIIDGSDRYHYR